MNEEWSDVEMNHGRKTKMQLNPLSAAILQRTAHTHRKRKIPSSKINDVSFPDGNFSAWVHFLTPSSPACVRAFCFAFQFSEFARLSYAVLLDIYYFALFLGLLINLIFFSAVSCEMECL